MFFFCLKNCSALEASSFKGDVKRSGETEKKERKLKRFYEIS